MRRTITLLIYLVLSITIFIPRTPASELLTIQELKMLKGSWVDLPWRDCRGSDSLFCAVPLGFCSYNPLLPGGCEDITCYVGGTYCPTTNKKCDPPDTDGFWCHTTTRYVLTRLCVRFCFNAGGICFCLGERTGPYMGCYVPDCYDEAPAK